jgi:TolA-binding protein
MELAVFLAATAGCSMSQMQEGPWAFQRAELQRAAMTTTAPVRGADDPRMVMAYDAAVGLVDAGQYAQAEPQFARLVGQLREARDLERATKAWFWMAFCMEKAGQAEAAAGEYRRLIAQHPGSRSARLAQGRLDRLSRGPTYKRESR